MNKHIGNKDKLKTLLESTFFCPFQHQEVPDATLGDFIEGAEVAEAAEAAEAAEEGVGTTEGTEAAEEAGESTDSPAKDDTESQDSES